MGSSGCPHLAVSGLLVANFCNDLLLHFTHLVLLHFLKIFYYVPYRYYISHQLFITLCVGITFRNDSSSAIPCTAPATVKHSATSRKVMHHHHFVCSLPRSRSGEPAETRCRP